MLDINQVKSIIRQIPL